MSTIPPTTTPTRPLSLLKALTLVGVSGALLLGLWEGAGVRSIWGRPWFRSAETANDASVKAMRDLNQTLKSPELDKLATQFEAVVKENAQLKSTGERMLKFLSTKSEADSLRTELEKIIPSK